MSRRLMFAALALSTGAMAVCSGIALAKPVQDPVPIGPNEGFVGLVNGSSSNAVIRMACFGAIHPGEKGHPFAGQTVEVQLNMERPAGFTGNARRIAAALAFPAPTPQSILLATFSNYFVPAPISTALTFPCAGSGRVAFTPVHGGPKARTAVVGVSFVGQP